MANGEAQQKAAGQLAITVAAISTVGLLGFVHCPGMCPGAHWLLFLAVVGGVAHLLAEYMSSRGDASLPWSRVSHWACLASVVSFLIGGTLGIAAASRNA